MATASDVSRLALKHLGVIGAGETPTAADNDEGEEAYARVYAEMQEDGFALWATAAIPDYLVDALMRCVAARIRPLFETTQPALHEAETRSADMNLKALLRRKRTRAPVEIEDF